jgi:hypothetical protein
MRASGVHDAKGVESATSQLRVDHPAAFGLNPPRMESKTVTREALYEEAWATPLTTLAKVYGISDVALAKVCRRLNVPLPGRGYWAKVAAGHAVKKWPLPKTAKLQVATIEPPRPRRARPPEEILPQPETIAHIGAVELPAEGERTHPITAKTRRYFEDVKRRVERHARKRPNAPYIPGDWPPHDDHGRYCCNGDGGFHVTVSLQTLDRALRLVDALAKTLGKHGFRFEHKTGEKRGYERQTTAGLVAEKSSEQFHFHLREGYSRREYSAKELLEAKRENRYIGKYDYSPNGKLAFEFGGTEWGIAETFQDTKKVTLEAELGRIVATFVDAVSRQAALRQAREEAARLQREAEHLRWLERERVRKEEEQVERLLAEAERARKFQMLREYLDLLERQTLRNGEISEQGRAWLVEARRLAGARLAGAYDPAMKRLGQDSGHEDTDESDDEFEDEWN